MESTKIDLKNTIHLPHTGFPMKASLPQLEPKLLEQWDKTGLYNQIRQARDGSRVYILHDGPPYANGNIHLGHAFNKLLKDFIVKFKTMEGYDSPYVPGWDCHGLPIEIKVDSQLGPKKAQMSTVQIRAACRKYAEKYVELQKRDFIRLGVLGRWENPYLTMSAGYEAVIAQAFVDFLDRGYVYKGVKPVNWCIHDRTALAEAEVEYENHTSPSIWVRFFLVSDPAAIDSSLAGRRVYGLIWTTTPWTIPANMAIAFHPKFKYVAVEVGDGSNGDVYIVAKELVGATAETCGWKHVNEMAEFPGQRLESAVFRHPFLERNSLGILANHVTLEQGTGAVHTAPGHGQEDYLIGQSYGIATYCPVDASGRFYQAPGAEGPLPETLLGKTVWEGNAAVIELLKERRALLASQKIDHSYPHCWRCHNATIFRATEQWFIAMDHNNLRERALEAIKGVKWKPGWGEERISNMIATRPDWCISRQRAWGVPILVFYCEACNHPLTDRSVLDPVVELIRQHTADIWYSKTAEELLGPGFKCAQCGGSAFSKENDILDVWFDSGASHLAVLTDENRLSWPADMYLEGGDQYRGWFHSSLLVGVGLKDGAPYRASATNGWTLDGEGHALSKSKGAEEVEIIIKKYGAELLRLWTASVDFTEDVRFSETIVARLVEAYRKLRNTLKYALGNLHDFDPARDAVPMDEMLDIDRWILSRAEDVIRRCRAWYDELEFHKVSRAVYDFAVTDLSALYSDVLKARLYTAATFSRARRSGQTALYRIHYALVRLIAPLLAFTAEEAWLARHGDAPGNSIHLQLFPEVPTSWRDAELGERWANLRDLRRVVTGALELERGAKRLGSSLQAAVDLYVPERLVDLLREVDLAELCITSAGTVLCGPVPEDAFILPDVAEVGVRVTAAPGNRCERCWRVLPEVGQVADHPELCRRCAAAVGRADAG